MSTALKDNLAAQTIRRNANAERRNSVIDAIMQLAQQKVESEATGGQTSGLPPVRGDVGGPLGSPVDRRLAQSNPNAPYKRAEGIPGGGLTTIGVNGEKWTVAKGAAGAFQGFLNEITKKGYKAHSSGGYVDRDIRGRPGVKSEHAYGRAIDVNAASNPMLNGKLVTDMPAWVPALAAKYGLTWGGNWKNRKDPMHFEYDK